MPSRIHTVSHSLAILLLATLYALLTSCGGGGGGSGSVSAQGSGNVALMLTDAPASGFDEINLDVRKAELLSDNGRVTIFEGNRRYNLLDLTDAHLFALREGVPAGDYSKLRLTLGSLELVSYNGTDDPADDLVVYPKLPGNGKLDLNPRGSFTVSAGETLVLQLDLDANKSIHIVQHGSQQVYEFRPVVFVDIVTDTFHDRYVKVHGTVQSIDSGTRRFSLCDLDIDRLAAGSNGCVAVEVPDGTPLFGDNGMPAAFGDLVEGGEATVFGRLQRDHADDGGWYDLDDRVLVAGLIELGPVGAFISLTGEAASEVDVDDRFLMDVDPGQGLTTPLQLTVQLQNGTRLINRRGELLDSTAIQTGRLLKARGVLDVGSDTLFASLVVIDTDSSVKLSGSIGSNPGGSCGLTLLTDSGDRSIRTSGLTEVFLVSISGSSGSSEAIGTADLLPGLEADVYGHEALDGCFDADVIVAFDPTP